jgi:hypothetical protein
MQGAGRISGRIATTVTHHGRRAVSEDPPMKNVVRSLIAVSCLAAAAAAAHAQGFPARPVRLIVPFPAGGTTDILAREVSAELAPEMGTVPVTVDNKGGASGTIGSRGCCSAVGPRRAHADADRHASRDQPEPAQDIAQVRHQGPTSRRWR